MDKEQLRISLRESLLELTAEQRGKKSKEACRNLISTPQFQDTSVVMMYLSLPHEVDTCEAILSAWQQGKTVAVPKVSWQQRHMIAVQINSLETGFSTDSSGLRNPATGVPLPFEEIDLVVTPGLGFDRKGNRLGRGASYYDRFFAGGGFKSKKCGFAFEEQVVDMLPVDEHDVPMDFLVTDKQVMYFTNNQGE